MPQSKFGGIAVEDEPKTGGSKFGGVPVEEPPTEKPVAEAPPQTFGHAAEEFGKQVNPVSMITGAYNAIRHPLDTRENLIEAGANELGKARNLFGEGRYSEAAGHGMAGLIPAVGPAAAKVGEQIGGGDVAGGLGAGAGLITSILAPSAITKGVGKIAQTTARPFVRSALGIPAKAHAFDADPEGAVLRDTSGVRPATIAKSAQESINRLVPERERIINSAIKPIDLQEPRTMVTDRLKGPEAGGNVPLTSQMRTMEDALSRNRVTDHQYPQLLPPSDALNLEREFGDEFASYNPATHERANALAKDVTGNLRGQIYAAAPEAQPLGRRIQGLIPAKNRAMDVSRNATGFQQALDRFSRPTGAVAPAILGKMVAGNVGALAGIPLSQVLSDPIAKMIAARSLYGGGRLLMSPAVSRGAQGAAVLSRNQ